MFLFTECSKLMVRDAQLDPLMPAHHVQVSEMDFHDSILTLAFPEEVNATLLAV